MFVRNTFATVKGFINSQLNKMKLTKHILLTLVSITSICLFNINTAIAQEAEEAPLDTLARSVHKLQDELAILKKIKISGYIQAQFQVADSVGSPSFAGGDFDKNTDKRFMIRRGRIKFVYDNKLTNYVLQFNATEKEVRVKEAYVKITEPWLQAISLQMGIFDVPFGFEAPVSSSALESPERGRMSQTLLPDENDLGGMITFQMPKTSKFNFLKLEAGMFNGTQAKAPDFDWKKDFIGRLSVSKVSKSEKFKYGVGVSYYDGGVRQATNVTFEDIGTLANGNVGFIMNDTSAIKPKGKITRRNYMGADAQISFDFPFGITTIKAEYITGVQPGVAGSSKSPSADPAANAYVRSFDGAYFYFVQNIFQTKHQIVVKYDWYDPNTKVSGDEIGKTGSGLGTADLKFTTLGFGYNYKWDNNVKITLYYDMVTNETSKNLVSKGYWRDIPDNVFTLRFQYKF
jgi:hypothetical protein